MLYLLDYGAGNVRSLANSIKKLGHDFEWITSPQDFQKADKLIFPGVGAFAPAIDSLNRQGYAKPLKAYIASGRPYMGICIGMQALFESSTEGQGKQGLAIVPGQVDRFSTRGTASNRKSVPQMGWNSTRVVRPGAQRYGLDRQDQHYYFVHSYRVAYDETKHADWALTLTQYGDEVFISSIQKGNVFATQFHPEKSGKAGLELLRAWLEQGTQTDTDTDTTLVEASDAKVLPKDGLTKRVVACLDVRTNDEGDLVVTKGESYDVREKAASSSTSAAAGGAVRNLGKPVDLALRYYLAGADEIVFLNITSFRSCPLQDQPMLSVLSHAAASIFVPLTIGGGIKDTVDPDGTKRSALDVATAYFRAGADKVSIGSEAVYAVEDLLSRCEAGVYDPATVPRSSLPRTTPIEEISVAYGAQAVVVSIDPRRVYLSSSSSTSSTASFAHAPSVVRGLPGSPDEGKAWWYRCTVKGGREDRDVDVVQLARGVELLGAGELLLNSIDRDGSAAGFDRQLIDLVRASVGIPVVASSGAGNVGHFADVFEPRVLREGQGRSSVEAALAAGIFHRGEVGIREVKDHLAAQGFEVRREDVGSGVGAEVIGGPQVL